MGGSVLGRRISVIYAHLPRFITYDTLVSAAKEAAIMSTKQPRLNVVLEPSIYETLYKLSKKEGVSMSLVARDLLREALTIHEDTFWAKEAVKREKNLTKRKSLRHRDVWGS